jgi:formylglycine-generating enzyme required for sulfatase activity
MKNMLKALGIIAITALIGFSMIACDTDGDSDDKEIKKPGKQDGPTKYVMDVSEISGWDLMVFAKDGSSMVLKLDETTLMPTHAYINPQKDSDNGFSIWFKTNGLPDLMVTNDHIVCYGNFDGYTFDLAVIKPNGEIEEHNNNQTDVNWDTFNEVFFQGNSGNARSVFDLLRGGKNVKGEDIPFTLANILDCIGTGAGLASCITAPLIPGAAIGCGIFLLSQVTGEVVQIATKDNDLASDIGGTLISALGCVTLDPWDCASTAVGLYTLIDDNAAKVLNKGFELMEKGFEATLGKMIEKKNYVAVTGIKLNKTAITLPAGGLATSGTLERLIATVLPSNATRGNSVTWSSSNGKVAEVCFGDYVLAEAEGTAVITVRTVEGNFKATCTVTVLPVATTRVTLNKTTLSLAVGGQETLTATVQPSNATNKNVFWSSSNSAVATVSSGSGTVTAVAEGTATITATTSSSGGISYAATCFVTVTATTTPTEPTDPTTISSPTGIELVLIPGGTFTMGSPTTEADRNSDETQHTVTLSAFYMGKYQVTQEQYQAVMGSNPSNFTSAVAGESGTPGKLPVEKASWYDALVFCNKLSIKEGLTPAYSISGKTNPADWGTVPTSSNATWNAVVIVAGSTGYRLPTEAQWEYACRAGKTTAYNTGNTVSDNIGWYSSNSGGKTHQVGLKAVNAWGLYDMHGNVWEWCWDWFGSYSTGAQTDPMGASLATLRVARGGSWSGSAEYLRSASRGNGGSPGGRYDSLGFRLARP